MIIHYLWMKKILKAILFDLDDTLYLEKDFVKSGFKTVATLIQNDNGIDKEVVYMFLGPSGLQPLTPEIK